MYQHAMDAEREGDMAEAPLLSSARLGDEEEDSAPPASPSQAAPPAGKRMRDVVVLGVGFLLIFSAFTVVQNLASSVFVGQLGFWSLGTLYIVFALATLTASFVVQKLGLRLSLILGGLTYVWYVIANVLALKYEGDEAVQFAVMIPAAALLGVGASTIWTAEGSYVTLCADETTLGSYTGTFFFVFILNNVIGNLGAAALFNAEIDTLVLFELLALVALIGAALFFFLRPVARPSVKTINTEQSIIARAPIVEVFALMLDFRMAWLSLIIGYTGATQTFFSGNLPLFINNFGDGSTRYDDLALKLYLLAALGIADAGGSIAFGRLSDRTGRLPLLLLGAVLQAIAYILLFVMPSLNRLDILFPCACLLGLGDAAFNTQIGGILGYLFRANSEAAFANFKLFQSLVTGVLFFLSDMTTGPSHACELETCPNMAIWTPLMLSSLAAGMGGLLVLRAKRVAFDPQTRRAWDILSVK